MLDEIIIDYAKENVTEHVDTYARRQLPNLKTREMDLVASLVQIAEDTFDAHAFVCFTLHMGMRPLHP